jgi:hypothetical protein
VVASELHSSPDFAQNLFMYVADASSKAMLFHGVEMGARLLCWVDEKVDGR